MKTVKRFFNWLFPDEWTKYEKSYEYRSRLQTEIAEIEQMRRHKGEPTLSEEELTQLAMAQLKARYQGRTLRQPARSNC